MHHLGLGAGLRVHQDKRKLGRQFATECAEEKLHLDRVRHDDTERVPLIRLRQKSSRGEALVLVLDLTVEGDSAALLDFGDDRPLDPCEPRSASSKLTELDDLEEVKVVTRFP